MSKPNSLQNTVAAFVKERRAATVDEIREQFPDRSKEQIRDALHNARQKQMVRCIKRGNPNIWGASVFHQADPITVQGVGTVYRLLGE
jgi:uncharacterized membrane protein